MSDDDVFDDRSARRALAQIADILGNLDADLADRVNRAYAVAEASSRIPLRRCPECGLATTAAFHLCAGPLTYRPRRLQPSPQAEARSLLQRWIEEDRQLPPEPKPVAPEEMEQPNQTHDDELREWRTRMDVLRAKIREWAIYCFRKHGHDAHLYNGLAEMAGMEPW